MFPKLAILIYHNPVNHKVKIPVSVFQTVKYPNIIGMKDSHRDTREFVRLMEIIRGKISVMTNQAQMFPTINGISDCWSIDAVDRGRCFIFETSCGRVKTMKRFRSSLKL